MGMHLCVNQGVLASIFGGVGLNINMGLATPFYHLIADTLRLWEERELKLDVKALII